MKTLKAVARKVGPKTSRDAAKKFQSSTPKEVYRALKRIGPATCEQVILELKEGMAPGKVLREDPISGMFNQLCLIGRIAPTGKEAKNTSGMSAMLWRITSPEERSFLKEYVGGEKRSPWPSPDTLLELEDVRKALRDHPSKEVRRMYRRYRKGILFKTLLKDKGIKWFMKNYETNGRRKD